MAIGRWTPLPTPHFVVELRCFSFIFLVAKLRLSLIHEFVRE